MKTVYLIVFVTICCPIFLVAQESTELEVGEIAPKLVISEWLRGKPITAFKKEDKKIYVVYFTGTWCPPCVKSIPQLNNLQKKYINNITVISVYMENSTSKKENIKRVTNLMEALDNKMEFTIAIDEPSSSRKAWGLKGPAIYMVQSGRISWAGDNLGELEPALEQVEAGTFNSLAVHREQLRYRERLNNINEAKINGNFQFALEGIDRLIDESENYPARLASLYYQKLRILAGDDDKEAYKWLQWLLERRVEGFVWPRIEAIFYQISPENRDYRLELRAMNRIIEESETKGKTVYPLRLKAEIYGRMGDYEKAVEMIRKAIKVAENEGINNENNEKLLKTYSNKFRIMDNP
ncbi:redoxin family protein [Muricauda sp. TY007]|uniref:redoxin family protein n=1 Tax=Allomuricauda sp. TY007 TaxID=2683200 RepID=UPI0013C033C2|nr:redoxin family protein [Muricauda sp. TY007]NDV15766.1 redoxin family protein [Muricauda sp. TY007]